MTMKRRKILLWILIIVVVFSIYEVCLQPHVRVMLVSVVGLSEREGLDFYENGTYLLKRKGRLFRSYVSSMDFGDQCTPVDFYYLNSWLRDNLYYGKAPDVFSLEVQVHSQEAYDAIKEQADREYDYVLRMLDYESYYVAQEKNLIARDRLRYRTCNRMYLAFCDDDLTIRYIMITENLDDGYRVTDFQVVMDRYTSLEWHSARCPKTGECHWHPIDYDHG